MRILILEFIPKVKKNTTTSIGRGSSIYNKKDLYNSYVNTYKHEVYEEKYI